MPELPEVETLRRSLIPELGGRCVERIRVLERRLRYPVSPGRLRSRLLGRRFVTLGRRSKYLVVDCQGAQHLLVHLGMSGSLYLSSQSAALEPHVHVCFDLDDGRQLRYRDPRRFGLIDVLDDAELAVDRRLTDLGVEPLSTECSGAYLHERSRGLRRAVKSFLMDARQIVGVGNIYASEALFEARIHPGRAAGRVGPRSWDRLARAIRGVLESAIERGGTTILDFRDGHGQAGRFQECLRVYGRAGQPCARCSREIRLRVLLGRSTYYCPGCQR